MKVNEGEQSKAEAEEVKLDASEKGGLSTKVRCRQINA